MKLPARRREELDKLVNKFCEKNNLNMKRDLFQELSKIGFVVHGVRFKKPLSGMILVSEKEKRVLNFSSNKVIAYNAENDLYDVRFIVLHELAHYIYEKELNEDKEIIVAARDHTVGYSENIDEQEKDYMAAAMLLPKDELKTEISDFAECSFDEVKNNEEKKQSLITDSYFIQKIQREYRVSEITVTRRLEELFDEVS